MNEIECRYTERLDSVTSVIYLEMPARKIVMLTALLEGYDGMALVRTVDERIPIVSLFVTHEMLKDCRAFLDAERHNLHWRAVPRPEKFDDVLVYQRME